jgi:hypothetical protein
MAQLSHRANKFTEETLVCHEGLCRMEGNRPCCIHDEGRFFGVAFQEEIPNRPELRRSRAWVVSVREKAEQDSVRCVCMRRMRMNH